MKNSKIFSLGLYLEGIKQLKTFGIIFSIIYAIEALLIPIGSAISINANSREIHASAVTGIEVHPILFLTFIVVAPIMTLSLFSFLNKRNSSDFYHALPHSRVSLFLSFFAAVMTWIAFIILSSGVISIIVNLILNKFFTLMPKSFFMLMLFCFVASLLVVSSILIAMSITGTLFNNVVVSLLILFLPRFVYYIINMIVSYKIPVFVANPMENGLNIFINFFLSGVLSGGDISEAIYNVKGIIYTAFIAIVYALIGCILFKIRKSEVASHSAPNRFMQAAYRIIITMTFCLFICGVMITSEDDIFSPEMFFGYVVLYLIAIFIYFIYELLTTKKLKNLLRAIPGLLIVAILNIALILGLNIGCNIELNFTPSAKEIQSVCLTDSYSYWYSLTYSEYVNLSANSYEIKDAKVNELISDSLKDCVDTFKEHEDLYYNKYYSDKYTSLDVKIKTKTQTKYRSIFIPSDKLSAVYDVLWNDKNYRELFLNLPKPIENTMYMSGVTLSDEQMEEIFKCMQKEIKKADFETWYEVVMSDNANSTDFLHYQTTVNNKQYYISIPLSPATTPKACEKYYQYVYEQNKDQIEALKSLKENDDIYDLSFYLCIYDKDSNTYATYSYYHEDEYLTSNDMECIDFVLDNIDDKPISVYGSYVIVSIQNFNDPYYEGLDMKLALKDVDIEELFEFKRFFREEYISR